MRVDATEETLLGALATGVDPGDAWRTYRDRHPDVLALYENTFGGTTRTAAELGGAAAAAIPRLRARAAALDLERTLPRVAGLLELEDSDDLEAVTFVGWDHAIAWCSDECAEPRVHFALERLPVESLTCLAFGAHELAHLAHIRTRPGDWAAWNVTTGIFSEAVAIATTQALVPELDLAEQVMLQPGAREAYAAARPAIHAELLELLDHGDEATYRRVLFPPALCEGAVAGANETGYLVAIALVDRWAARSVSTAAAARMTPAEARAELIALLSR